MSEDSNSIKKRIEELVTNSKVIDKNNEKLSSTVLIQKLFEVMGWKYDTDVRIENFENTTVKAFQIDNVTRFYLKEFTTDSLETVTNDIKSVVSYAYNRGVTWAIISNFNEMRIYNTESQGKTLASMLYYSFTSLEYIEKFEKVSDLSKKQFSLNVLDDNAEYFGKRPKRIPIDKQLLEDLLHYRDILLESILSENSISENDAELASQKIINRFIFIRSCGDRQIENRYLISAIHEWKKNPSKKLIYFIQEIFSYFHGRYGSALFEKHICDNLKINDNVLLKVIEGTYQSKNKAIQYNFAHIEHDSLGKIYENYLGTIQQKKDGAYYTPTNVSGFMCENTIIPYLSKTNVTNISDLISEYDGSLEELESKIHKIKIIDPACGTGEFLIRAVDILLEISNQIQLQKEKSGRYTHMQKGKKSGTISYQTFDKEVENQELRNIIQNNIFGVDINDEAIEITQLNLFLKLATSSKQLVDLSGNFRVGDSLIDNPIIEPNAFDWKKEFPDKFDIVIGNPPYAIKFSTKQKNYLKKKFPSVPDFESSDYFILKSFELLKNEGISVLIVPNTIILNIFAKSFRNHLINNFNIKKIINLSEIDIFTSATIRNCILIISKDQDSNETIFETMEKNFKIKNSKKIKKKLLSEQLNSWHIFFNLNELSDTIRKKMHSNAIKLGDLANVSQGLIPYDKYQGHSEETIKNRIWHSDHKKDESFKRELKGADVKRYALKWNGKIWISYGPWLGAPREKKFFTQKRILIREITNPHLLASLTSEEFYNTPSIINVTDFKKVSANVILAIINSKLMSYYHNKFSPKAQKGDFPKVLVTDVKNFPIIIPSEKIITKLENQVIKIMNERDPQNVERINSEIDFEIYRLYQLDEIQIQHVSDFIDGLDKKSK